MITETAFASSHQGFWHDLLPMGETYIRFCNLELSHFVKPLATGASANERGLVNELAFRLFGRCWANECESEQFSADVIAAEAEEARRFIESFRQHGRGALCELSDAGRDEALALCERMRTFFLQADVPNVALEVRPEFAGCGWLSSCAADVFGGGTLYEIKAGDRTFRSTDLRQALVYCALAFASKERDVTRVCLMNPRHGVFFSESLADMCEAMAGRTATEVLNDIVDYVASPFGTYNSG